MSIGVMADSSVWKKVLFLVLMIFIGSILFSVVGVFIATLLYGQSAIVVLTQLSIDVHNIGAIKVIQVFQSLGMFVIPGFLALLLFTARPSELFRIHRRLLPFFFLALLTMVAALPGINFLGSVNELVPLPVWMVEMEKQAQTITEAFLAVDTFGGVLFNLFMIALLPAVGEELVFRGMLQRWFIQLSGNRTIGVVVTAFLFSAIHMQFAGFLPRFALGVILGCLFLHTGNILVPMAAHFFNNALVLVTYVLMSEESRNMLEGYGKLPRGWIMGVASIALVVFLLYRIKSEARNVDSVLSA